MQSHGRPWSIRKALADFRREGVPIAWLLPLVLGGLVTIAVLPVVLLGFIGAGKNTDRLLRDRNEFIVSSFERGIQAYLEPVENQLNYIAGAVAGGAVDANDPAAYRAFVLGAVAATPQVRHISYIRRDGTGLHLVRNGQVAMDADIGPLEAAPDLAGGDGPAARWLAPSWDDDLRKVVIQYRVFIGTDRQDGVLLAAVTADGLSAHLDALADDTNYTPFVLLGREQVLAHPMLAAVNPTAWMTQGGSFALPRLDAIGDGILAGIWTRERNPLGFTSYQRAQGHWSWVGTRSYAFLYRTVGRFGTEPWTLGVYFPGTESRIERWTVLGIAIGGTVLLLLAVWVSAMVGRRLAQPIGNLAEAAREVAAFDFDAARKRIQHEQVRELNQAGSALRQMAAGLRWFETYVPRTLVRRLMVTGQHAEAFHAGEDREVTIMFADLEGYSGFSAGCSAAEAAAYLNELLARIGPAIEASGGTIDKYMGDGIMAFWGAPDSQPDHAAAACAAALTVAKEAAEVNRLRRENGKAACPLRIGLHTGVAVVGNIGFPGRMDYTIVGQAVNTAQRIEQLGRRHRQDSDAVILVSAATRKAAGDQAFDFAALSEGGIPASRDFQAALPIFRLKDRPAD